MGEEVSGVYEIRLVFKIYYGKIKNGYTPILGLNSIKNYEKSPIIAYTWAFLNKNHSKKPDNSCIFDCIRYLSH